MFGKKKKKTLLKYSFIDNDILLSMETIKKNGFIEIYRQENKQHSIQILCFNQEKQEFQAFDRFHWVDEPIYERGNGYTAEGWYYKKDLWTPIIFHFTQEWLCELFKDKT